MAPNKKWNVTVTRFRPADGVDGGETFVLPVDCPDAEHAVSATLSNCIAWTTKTSGMNMKSIAFIATKVEERL